MAWLLKNQNAQIRPLILAERHLKLGSVASFPAEEG